MYIEAFIIDDGLTGTVKALAGRKRPYLYNDDLPMSKRKSGGKNFYAHSPFLLNFFFCLSGDFKTKNFVLNELI